MRKERFLQITRVMKSGKQLSNSGNEPGITGILVEKSGKVVSDTGNLVGKTGNVLGETGNMVWNTGDLVGNTGKPLFESGEEVSGITCSKCRALNGLAVDRKSRQGGIGAGAGRHDHKLPAGFCFVGHRSGADWKRSRHPRHLSAGGLVEGI